MPGFGDDSPSFAKMDLNNGRFGGAKKSFNFANIAGDPFSLATIGIAIVSGGYAIEKRTLWTNASAVRLVNSIRELDPRRCQRRVPELCLVDSGVYARLHHRCLCDRGNELRRYVSCGDCGLPGGWAGLHHIVRELDDLLQ